MSDADNESITTSNAIAQNEPIIASQTIAQNEAVKNVLSRFIDLEIVIPAYQRDADQWDMTKKSKFIESVLNRLTVPAIYLSPTEPYSEDVLEVVDGQQRLTTLLAFFQDQLTLSESDECSYYTNSSHYAGKKYSDLADTWQKYFRNYVLTLVTLPRMNLSLRLEIFRRINEGGTPLSGQDIRLSYYSESACVLLIQVVGIFDSSRLGAIRMIGSLGYAWPWAQYPAQIDQWKEWWGDSKFSVGQTSSEMFLWYIVGRYRIKVDAVLADKRALSVLKVEFRGNTDEVLDITCAQFKQEDTHPEMPRLFPSLEELRQLAFAQFSTWWYEIRMHCGPSASTAKHRAIALLIPALEQLFGRTPPTAAQWGHIASFLNSTQAWASRHNVKFPEARGKWNTQRKQLSAFDEVATKISEL